MKPPLLAAFLVTLIFLGMQSCKPKNAGNAVTGDAAAKAYVAPGKYDEFYNFVIRWIQRPNECIWSCLPDVYCGSFLFFPSILKKDMDTVKKPNPC